MSNTIDNQENGNTKPPTAKPGFRCFDWSASYEDDKETETFESIYEHDGYLSEGVYHNGQEKNGKNPDDEEIDQYNLSHAKQVTQDTEENLGSNKQQVTWSPFNSYQEYDIEEEEEEKNIGVVLPVFNKELFLHQHGKEDIKQVDPFETAILFSLENVDKTHLNQLVQEIGVAYKEVDPNVFLLMVVETKRQVGLEMLFVDLPDDKIEQYVHVTGEDPYLQFTIFVETQILSPANFLRNWLENENHRVFQSRILDPEPQIIAWFPFTSKDSMNRANFVSYLQQNHYPGTPLSVFEKTKEIVGVRNLPGGKVKIKTIVLEVASIHVDRVEESIFDEHFFTATYRNLSAKPWKIFQYKEKAVAVMLEHHNYEGSKHRFRLRILGIPNRKDFRTFSNNLLDIESGKKKMVKTIETFGQNLVISCYSGVRAMIEIMIKDSLKVLTLNMEFTKTVRRDRITNAWSATLTPPSVKPARKNVSLYQSSYPFYSRSTSQSTAGHNPRMNAFSNQYDKSNGRFSNVNDIYRNQRKMQTNTIKAKVPSGNPMFDSSAETNLSNKELPANPYAPGQTPVLFSQRDTTVHIPKILTTHNPQKKQNLLAEKIPMEFDLTKLSHSPSLQKMVQKTQQQSPSNTNNGTSKQNSTTNIEKPKLSSDKTYITSEKREIVQGVYRNKEDSNSTTKQPPPSIISETPIAISNKLQRSLQQLITKSMEIEKKKNVEQMKAMTSRINNFESQVSKLTDKTDKLQTNIKSIEENTKTNPRVVSDVEIIKSKIDLLVNAVIPNNQKDQPTLKTTTANNKSPSTSSTTSFLPYSAEEKQEMKDKDNQLRNSIQSIEDITDLKYQDSKGATYESIQEANEKQQSSESPFDDSRYSADLFEMIDQLEDEQQKKHEEAFTPLRRNPTVKGNQDKEMNGQQHEKKDSIEDLEQIPKFPGPGDEYIYSIPDISDFHSEYDFQKPQPEPEQGTLALYQADRKHWIVWREQHYRRHIEHNQLYGPVPLNFKYILDRKEREFKRNELGGTSKVKHYYKNIRCSRCVYDLEFNNTTTRTPFDQIQPIDKSDPVSKNEWELCDLSLKVYPDEEEKQRIKFNAQDLERGYWSDWAEKQYNNHINFPEVYGHMPKNFSDIITAWQITSMKKGESRDGFFDFQSDKYHMDVNDQIIFVGKEISSPPIEVHQLVYESTDSSTVQLGGRNTTSFDSASTLIIQAARTPTETMEKRDTFPTSSISSKSSSVVPKPSPFASLEKLSPLQARELNTEAQEEQTNNTIESSNQDSNHSSSEQSVSSHTEESSQNESQSSDSGNETEETSEQVSLIELSSGSSDESESNRKKAQQESSKKTQKNKTPPTGIRRSSRLSILRSKTKKATPLQKKIKEKVKKQTKPRASRKIVYSLENNIIFPRETKSEQKVANPSIKKYFTKALSPPNRNALSQLPATKQAKSNPREWSRKND